MRGERGSSGPGDEIARRDELLEALAHELRSVLNVVLTWTHILSSGQLDASSSERGIESIRRSAELQAQLISDALDLSQILAGRLTLNVRSVNVAYLLTDALESLRGRAVRCQVLMAPAQGDGASILADPVRLEQILDRLLASAVDSCGRGNVVSVDVASGDVMTDIAIRIDHGGASIDNLINMLGGEAEGTRPGLGLRVARHLVEMHRGTLDVTRTGDGVTLMLRLPTGRASR
jgi:signal transduction histidine kinase